MRLKKVAGTVVLLGVMAALFFAGTELGKRLPLRPGEPSGTAAQAPAQQESTPAPVAPTPAQVAGPAQFAAATGAATSGGPGASGVPIPGYSEAQAQPPAEDGSVSAAAPTAPYVAPRRPDPAGGSELTEEQAVAAMTEPGPEPDEELTTRVNRLITQLATPKLRTPSRDEIVAIGRPAVPVLISRKDDKNFTIRWEVVNIGGLLQDVRQLPYITDNVVRDENPHVRWRGMWALANYTDKRPIIHMLKERLADPSENETVHWNAAIGLSMMKSTDSLDMIHAGVSGPIPWRRWEAINALGRVYNDQTSTFLEPALRSTVKRERQEAVLSLGNVGDEKAIDILIAALNDHDPGVRWRACMSLQKARPARAYQPMKQLVESERDQDVLKYARATLAMLPVPPPAAPEAPR